MMLPGIKRIYAAIVLSLLLTGCATTQPYNPFKVERSEILARVKTIVILPMDIPGRLAGKDRIAARYESLMTAELTRGGFKVIPSKEYAAVWDPMVKQVGGVFNPATGEVDQEKYKSVRDLCFREMVSKYNADALLRSSVTVSKASWRGNAARWDGVTESATGREDFWGALNAPNASGTMPALSLVVVLADRNDKTYYAQAGGIQLLSHVRQGFLEGRFADVPEHELFADPAKDERAVKIAFSPLVDGPQVKSSTQSP